MGDDAAWIRGAGLWGFSPKPEKTGADLSFARLTGADLRNADLPGTNLLYANLSGANLTDAKLFGTYLTHADLTHADLTDARLDGQEQIDGACGADTKLPPGLTLKACPPAN